MQGAARRTGIVQRTVGGNQLDRLTSRQHRIAIRRNRNLCIGKVPVTAIRQRQHRAARSSGWQMKSQGLEVIDVLCTDAVCSQQKFISGPQITAVGFAPGKPTALAAC